MDISFHGLIGQSVEVYINDVMMFLNKRSNHLCHLKQLFERCRKYGILLNPKKSIFAVSEGNLLAHIISKSGIKVDPEMVKAIMEIPFKINFLRKFISDYTQIIKPM